MPYLIDGHNLIPHVHGLSLDQMDDELTLTALLEAYFRKLRKKAVVYFDHAQPGGSAETHGAFVQTRFVRPPAIADEAILSYLRRLGAEARNWVVVSSDQDVRRGAKSAGASLMSSTEFAGQLRQTGGPGAQNQNERVGQGEDETDFWLDVFGANEQP